MPDKEGSDDEKKSTKSVVNKKQKQMMGEEGYDVARDMGKVKPSKDKKDETTMPASKEMEKTRKVNKGPSALELVKKKYKGQIMDVKKEELDLTQVAESFGGYIVEVKITGDKSGDITGVKTTAAERAAAKKAQEKQKEIFKKAAAKTSKIKVPTSDKPKSTLKTMAKNIAQSDIEKTGQKFTQPVSGTTQAKDYKPKPGSVKLGEFPGAGPVKISNIKDVKPTPKPTPKPVVSPEKKVADAGADALKDMQKDTKVMGDITPEVKQEVKKAEKESRPKVSKFAGPQMTAAQKSKRFSQTIGTATGADPQSGRPTFMRSGVLTKSGKPKKAPKYKGKFTPDERVAKIKKQIDARNPTYIGKSGKPLPVPREEPGMKGFKGFKKRTQRSIVKTGKQVAKVAAPVTTPVAKFAKASPLGATIAGIEIAKITPGIKRFFTVKPPLPPKVRGGKVGRRTAG